MEQVKAQVILYNELPMEYQRNLGEMDLLDMIREVLNRFYLDTITAEQAASALQNKVSLLLMEQLPIHGEGKVESVRIAKLVMMTSLL